MEAYFKYIQGKIDGIADVVTRIENNTDILVRRNIKQKKATNNLRLAILLIGTYIVVNEMDSRVKRIEIKNLKNRVDKLEKMTKGE